MDVAQPPDTRGSAELRDAALLGLRWMGAARAAVEAAGFAASLVLARLIAPAEFGRAVVVLALLVVLGMVFSEGVSAPLVQRRQVGSRHLQAGAFICLAAGAAFVVASLTIVPAALAALVDERTGELAVFAAPAVIAYAASAVSRAMLQRELAFRALGIIELVPTLAGVPLAIVLAVLGLGAEAILAGNVGGALVQAALLARAARPPAPVPRRDEARDLVGVGGWSALAAVVHTAGRQAQFVIVGAGLGAAQLGIFWRAHQLGNEYQAKISGVMLRLALPLYARTRDREQIHRLRARIVRLHATLLIPMLGLLAVSAPEAVPLLFGDAWQAAIGPAQILTVAGMATVLTTGIGPLLVATGHARKLLTANLLTATLLVGAVAASASSGLIAVCWALSGATLTSFAYIHWRVLPSALGIGPSLLVTEAGPAFAASAALAAAGLAVAVLLREAGAAQALTFAATCAAGGAAYVTVLRLRFAAAWHDVRLVARRGLRRPPAGSSA